MANRRTEPSNSPEHGEVDPVIAQTAEGGLRAPRSHSFPIVGLGASAGGIEAFKRLFGALPPTTGMAYVLVQHLSPDHPSMLPEILGRATTMPVQQATDGMALAPNQVFVIPPAVDMVLADGSLKLSPRPASPAPHHPIDIFLRSLAENQGHKAIGVILSGTGSDGTLGLAEVKAAGGITFAQDESAQHDNMPTSAAATGCVDFVLSPAEIAEEIARISHHPYVSIGATPESVAVDEDKRVGKILQSVYRHVGVDFAHYKRSTLQRRIQRRLVLHKLQDLQDYERYLQVHPEEYEALFHDILISVTSFFRNPEAFEFLKATVFPRLALERPGKEPVRLWVLGCSTGEEAYSLAIAYTEYMESVGRKPALQVFATDLNGTNIEKARYGLYSHSINQDVSPERLRKYFVEVDGSYRISKTIREMCIFARHDVLTTPPFSNIDLLSCRNLLIYLETVLQQRVLPTLYYALRSGGCLWLGNSETISAYRDLFEPEDVQHRIYRKRSGKTLRLNVALPEFPSRRPTLPAPPPVEQHHTAVDAMRDAHRVLMTRYAPPGVLITSDLEILQFRGDTGPYLAPAPGKASLNLLKMIREGLLVGVQAAINKARDGVTTAREECLRVRSNGGFREVSVEVIPVAGTALRDTCYWVVFEEPGFASRPAPAEAPVMDATKSADALDQLREPRQEPDGGREVVHLRRELAATREYLQSVIEQQEAANEELQSANEEVQSANEELQSINEELETSKEEIQSSNEELSTVNYELQTRNQELSQSNNDFANLFNSVQLAIVMLGVDLRIRRFTPMAEKLFNLIPADLGRLICDIKHNVDIPELEHWLAEVIAKGLLKTDEVRDRDEHWYSLRIHPYKTLENKIDGAVLILVDIDALKRGEESLREADQSKTDFLAMLGHELRNPLAAVVGSLELLERIDAAHPDMAVIRGMFRQHAQLMVRLVDDLLDISRITQGRIEISGQLVDLSGVIQGAVEMARPLIESRKHALRLAGIEQPIPMQGDPNRLKQIVCNLLVNAAKYTDEGGQISLTVERNEQTATLRVTDNGTGIDQELLPYIFEPFRQGKRSLARSDGGLGVGLALARELARLHGGDVEAHSAGPGQGSEFAVRLPLSNFDESLLAPPAPKPRTPVPPCRVLVVEDNRDLAYITASVLTKLGHDVRIAHDGMEALAIAREFGPEIAVMDIGLPQIDGYELARLFRAEPALAQIYLIALTGYGQYQDRVRAKESGYDEHLLKPVTIEALEETLGRFQTRRQGDVE